MKRLPLAAAGLALALPCSAQFANTEVSGAPPWFMVSDTLWTYEDIPGVTYTFWRSTAPDAGFECILDMHAGNTWTGDTTPVPPTGVFHYLVTAFDGTVDNSPGNWSTGPRRTLDIPCPRIPPCASGTPVAGRVPLQLVSLGANFTRPMFLAAPAGDPRLFILERNGVIRIQHPDGTRTVFIDFSADIPSTLGEMGALGLAFHPDYASNGRFYVHYSGSPAGCPVTNCPACPDSSCSTISEFTVSANPDVADPATERQVFRTGHPRTNHNGGWTGFGPDGFLYFSIGDGGDQNDPFNRGQDLTTYLGKIMRIDVDNRDPGLPYAVPPDNPFLGVAGALPELWSIGMRNPWRNSFDRLTGDLYVGDVGQGCYEEISVATAATGGGRATNFGWKIMEGTHCFAVGTCAATGCNTTGLNIPVHDFAHSIDSNCAVTGGYVYRGCRMPDWNGVYFFSDYCGGWLDTLEYQDVPGTLQRILPAGDRQNPVSFGEDGAGEIYLVQQGGQIFRIEPQ